MPHTTSSCFIRPPSFCFIIAEPALSFTFPLQRKKAGWPLRQLNELFRIFSLAGLLVICVSTTITPSSRRSSELITTALVWEADMLQQPGNDRLWRSCGQLLSYTDRCYIRLTVHHQSFSNTSIDLPQSFFCSAIASTAISAGLTPEMRDACPSVIGRISFSFCRASSERCAICA